MRYKWYNTELTFKKINFVNKKKKKPRNRILFIITMCLCYNDSMFRTSLVVIKNSIENLTKK